ncbi:MAG: HAD family hydrolase [Christensenellales bacterium]
MKAYVFDLDGTLLDSMGVWAQIDVDFLFKRGFEVPPDYIDTIFAYSFQEAAQYTIERFGLTESVEELLREWYDMAIYAYGHTVTLKPYALEYLTALKEHGVKLGIATSLPAVLYQPALRNHHMEGLFDAIACTDEVAHGKTHPDVFYHAADKLFVRPCECMMFEDALEAVKGAKTAGMTVCGVYDESSKAQWEEIKKLADCVLYHFKDAPLPA